MAKVRTGRVVGVLLLGIVAFGLATSFDAEESAASAPEAAPAEAQANPPMKAGTPASEWAERMARVEELLSDCPNVTVHRLEAFANGSLRLSCSGPSTLRTIAQFRDAVENSPLARGKTCKAGPIQILGHETCELHGDVSEVSRFQLDLLADGPASSAEPGSLQLVARCRATH
jgi:hypothetical protein